MKRPKLDTTPTEWCPHCEIKVWSFASHIFVCPKMNPDVTQEDVDAFKRIDGHLQELAQSQLWS